MKLISKNIYFSIFIIVLSLTQLKAQTVYITESGTKYHTKNCSYVKNGAKKISMEDAIKRGLTSCAVCKVDLLKAKKQKKLVLKDSIN